MSRADAASFECFDREANVTMTFHVLKQLSKTPVPPVPKQLGLQVHERLNTILLGLHLLDFIARAIPSATIRFGEGLGRLVLYSLSGRYRLKPGDLNKVVRRKP